MPKIYSGMEEGGIHTQYIHGEGQSSNIQGKPHHLYLHTEPPSYHQQRPQGLETCQGFHTGVYILLLYLLRPGPSGLL